LIQTPGQARCVISSTYAQSPGQASEREIAHLRGITEGMTDAPKCMRCGVALSADFIGEINARRRRAGLEASPPKVCPACVLRVIAEMPDHAQHPETVRMRIDHHEIDPDTAKPIPAEWVEYVRPDVHARVVEELQAELDQSLHVIKTQAAELEEQRRWRAIVATEAKELGDQVDALHAEHEEIARDNQVIAAKLHAVSAERDVLRAKLEAQQEEIETGDTP
jgi:hypothetical protein